MKDLQTDQRIVVIVTIVALALTPAICDAQCGPIQSGETKIDCPIIGLFPKNVSSRKFNLIYIVVIVVEVKWRS